LGRAEEDSEDKEDKEDEERVSLVIMKLEWEN
jgi:hypothetical protein